MKVWKLFFDTLVFNLEGAGGAPADAPPADPPADKAAPAADPKDAPTDKPAPKGEGLAAFSDDSGDAEASKDAPADKGGAQPFYPEGLPDEMKGKTDQETIEKLWANRRQAPASPADYKLELPDDVVQVLGDLSNDPVVPIVAEIAHEIGLTNAEYSGFVAKITQRLQKEGLIETIDPQAEAAKLDIKETDPKLFKIEVAKRYNGAVNAIRDLHTKGVLSKSEVVALTAPLVRGEGVTAIEKIMKLIPKEQGLKTPDGGGDPTPQSTSRDDVLRGLYPSMFKG